MRFLIVAAATVFAVSSYAQQAPQPAPTKRVTRTKATGQATAIYGSTSNCSIPDLIPPKHQYSSYQYTSSDVAYSVCKEYVSYEADVSGKSWNTKDSEVPGTRRTFYKLETATERSSTTVPTYQVQEPDGTITYSVSNANWALANTQVILQCQNSRNDIERQSRPIHQTPCAQ